MADFDLLLRGGTVIDPAADLVAQRDVAVSGGRISAICDPSADTSADQVIDVSGLYVVPGLIDFHVHVFPGVSHYGVDADSSLVRLHWTGHDGAISSTAGEFEEVN